MELNIKNKQVREIYRRWKKIWENEKNKLEIRLKAFSIMNVIESIVYVYENNEMLNEEDIDDLYTAWGKGYMPILPEEYSDLKKRIQDQIKELNKIEKDDVK